MELFRDCSSELNFNFVEGLNVAEKQDVGRCVIILNDSYDDDGMSHKQRSQANARERYRTHRY